VKLRQALLVSAKVHRILEYGLRQLMAGKVDFATARCEAGLAVRELGFPDLFDWIDDVLSLNLALLSGWRDYTSGLHRAILDHWPAQELYRVSPRPTHRQWNGLDRENIIDGEPPQGRWVEAGGELYDGRMIALKDSSVWTKISRFGKPYSPFDFNSGMSTKGVTRAEAQKFGLIDRVRQVCLPKLPPPNDVILWEPEEEPADRCDARIRFMKQVSMSRTLVAESGSEALPAEAARIGLGAFAKSRSGKSRVFSERKPATAKRR
jgi:hypothetical protein